MDFIHTQLTAGRVIDTEQTRRFTATQMMEAREHEARMIFIMTPDQHGMGERVAIAESKEFARRLIACWNACAGISTEVMENMEMLGETFTDRFKLRNKEEKALTAQRDEAALHIKALLDVKMPLGEYLQAEQGARKWLEAVKGEAT